MRPAFPGLELVVRPCFYIVKDQLVFVTWDIPGGLLFDAAFCVGCRMGDSGGEALGG